MAPSASNRVASTRRRRKLEAQAHLKKMRGLRKGQLVRATVMEEQGGVVLCRKGDFGTVIAVRDMSVAHVDWIQYGRAFPTRTDQLERVDGSSMPIAKGVQVSRPLPVVDGKGGELLAANQQGTVFALQERVGVAVMFECQSGDFRRPCGRNAIWMLNGIEPVDAGQICMMRDDDLDFTVPEKGLDMPDFDIGLAGPAGGETPDAPEALEFFIDGSEELGGLLPGHGFIEAVGNEFDVRDEDLALRAHTPSMRSLRLAQPTSHDHGGQANVKGANLDALLFFHDDWNVVEI